MPASVRPDGVVTEIGAGLLGEGLGAAAALGALAATTGAGGGAASRNPSHATTTAVTPIAPPIP